MTTAIVWFRNDLRLHDHPALDAAHQAAEHVVPVFIFDDVPLKGKHSSPNRNRFLMESLEDLRASLQKVGTDLIVRRGSAADVLKQLAEETSAVDVYYTIDYTPYARKRDSVVTEELKQAGIELQAYPGRLAVDSFKGVYAANGNTYKVFTPFWKNWSTIDRREVHGAPRKLSLPAGLKSEAMPDPILDGADQLSPEVLPGGETAGRQRMHEFMKSGIHRYSDMHDTLTPDGTSRLSPYLHFGCISVREIEELIEQQPGGSAGPGQFHRQLAWRDFYNYVLFHFPDNATQEFQERFRDMPWSYDKDLLRAWQTGMTGYPVVDAAMRQMLREGWMHNRARLIVGSFFTKDLGLDWRLGERHFMRWLLDGDQANNNGNWQWISSVGVDPAPVFRRLYNPMTQQKRYDEDGSYVRYYVPELADVPDKYLAEPWKMSAEAQAEAKCVIGKDYPAPIVDHAQARLATLERFRAQTASA